MIDTFLKITRIILIVVAFISIIFHIGFVLELGVDIKYGVHWFSPEVFESYYHYMNLHLLFLLVLIAYLIIECKGGIRKHESNSSHNDSDTAKDKNN